MKIATFMIILFAITIALSFSVSANVLYLSNGTDILRTYEGVTYDSIYTGTGITQVRTALAGRYIGLIANNTYIYSNDYGVSFISSLTTLPTYLTELCVSEDGQYVFIGHYEGAAPSRAYYRSTNYGQTFTGVNAVGVAYNGVIQLDCSDDGKYVTVGDFEKSIFVSSDYGVTFTIKSIYTTGYPQDIFVDTTGEKQYVASGYAENPGGVLYSLNNGSSFSISPIGNGQTSYKFGVVNGTGVYSGKTPTNVHVLKGTTNSFANYSTLTGYAFTNIAVAYDSYWYAILNNSLVYRASYTNPLSWSLIATLNSSINSIDTAKTASSVTYGICFDESVLCYNPQTISNVTYCAPIDTTVCELGCVTLFNGAGYCLGTQTTGNRTYTPYPYTVTLSNINSYVNNITNQIYIEPVIVGSADILGYYQLFFNSPTNFITATCNYTETNVLNATYNVIGNKTGWSDYCNYQINVTDYGYGILLDTDTCTDQITKNVTTDITGDFNFKFDITPRSYDIMNLSQHLVVSFKSSLNQDIIALDFYYDSANNNMCISAYESLNQTINQIGCYPYDDTYAHIEGFVDFSAHTYSLTYENQGKYYTNPINFFYNGANIHKIFVSPVDGNSVSTIGNIIVATVPTYPVIALESTPFDTLSQKYYVQYNCVYSTIGCYTSRFYHSITGTQVYNSYDEWNVCSVGINGIDSNGVPRTNSWFDTKTNTLAQSTKYLIVLGIMFGIFLTCAIIGFLAHAEMVGVIAGAVMSAFTLIVFTLPGIAWIPAWITIFLVLFTLIVGVFVVFFNKSSGGAG